MRPALALCCSPQRLLHLPPSHLSDTAPSFQMLEPTSPGPCRLPFLSGRPPAEPSTRPQNLTTSHHLRHRRLAHATTVSHLNHCHHPVVPASTLSFSLTGPSTAAVPDHAVSPLKTLRFWLRKKAQVLTWTHMLSGSGPVRPSPLSRGSSSPPAHSFQAS